MELKPYLKLELKPLQWLNTSLRPQASISKFESSNLLQDSKEKKRENDDHEGGKTRLYFG